MLRIYSNLFFALSIGSASLLRITSMPEPLICFVAALLIAGALLSHLTRVRATGMIFSTGGLILAFHSAPAPSMTLAGILVYLAGLQIIAAALLIAADLSDVKEKASLES